MRKVGAVTGVLLAVCLLGGCGNSDAGKEIAAEAISATSIEIQKDGTVIETITETFPPDEYDVEKLRNMLLSEVVEYNSNTEPDISVEKFENKKDTVVAVIRYPSAEAYTEYNESPYDNKTLFYGTVSAAYDAGYSLDINMQNAKNKEETIGKEEILSMGDKNILITGEPVQVQTFGKILYTGENVTAAGKNKARLDAEEGQKEYYIIFN